jgi:hypothetical protein
VESPAVALNGSGAEPSASEQFLAAKVRELQEFLAPLSARRAQLEAEIVQIDREQRRIQKAVQALSGDDTRSKHAKPGTRTAAVHGRRDWSKTAKPRAENIEMVYNALQAADHPLSVAELHVATNAAVSTETITRAVAWLREQERIRIAGRVSTHGGKAHSNVYAVMA